MLEKFFEAPFTLNRLRAGPSGLYIDGFASFLETEQYSCAVARGFLRSAAHLGIYAEVRRANLDAVDSQMLKAFESHLPSCSCPRTHKATTGDVLRGAKLFLNYLRKSGRLQVADFEEKKVEDPELVSSFKSWLRQHRGVSESAQYTYGRGACDLIRYLGDDPCQYDAQSLRDFLLNRSKKIGPGATKSLVTSLRMFLRYLACEGKCRSGLEKAIPTLAGWRHASLPAYLQAFEVQRIINACDIKSLMGIRDQAIILLLVRLGLRAGDVSGLRLSDIDWIDGSILISGKGRFEVRLPLTQEVGDAILKYLEHRPRVDQDKVFLRILAPFRPFISGSAISSIVARTMERAKVKSPSHGAHILRHSAATEMLRKGVPLYEIASVLRHRSEDMTAYYAKVDMELLRQVVQPWPEVIQC